MGNQFIMPGKIVYGENALNNAKPLLKNFGKKALIVTDGFMVRLGNVKLVENILDELEIEYVVFDGVNSEPTDIIINTGLALYKDTECDFLIAVGGGSPIDAMKAIGAVVSNGGSINDYLGKEITIPTPPMAAIPTTSGTGSEATQFTIITNTEKDIKMLLKGAVLMPQLAIDDPAFTLTAPQSVTSATGLDALCHAAEAYTSRKAQPLTDEFALSAIKRIFKYLHICYNEGQNIKAREQMSLAALEAGIAFNNASVTIIHGMSRPIGALFHVPHGISNAMLIKNCFSYVYDGAYKRFADMARAIGEADSDDDDKTAAGKFITACEKLCEICHIPTLEEYGIDKEKFFEVIDKMAEDAVASGSPSNTIKDISKDDIIKIYKSLWD
ncbi:MAG: iron-containing alcohol dehydrogenase [Clostridium sp.]|nr:iron-containing alcohol dehydrogenase [Clostridium sp.]